MAGQTKRAVIIGAGIGGLATAIALRKIGWDAAVYESEPDVREAGAGLLIGANAMQALQRLGVTAAIAASTNALQALDILSANGQLLSRTPSRFGGGASGDGTAPADGDASGACTAPADGSSPADGGGLPDNVTIPRTDLLAALAAAAGRDIIQTNKRATRVEPAADRVRVHFADGTTDTADIIVAADGIHSAIRRQLLPHVAPRYAGYTCWRGVITADNSWPFDRSIATETWGAGARFGVAPLANDKIYWYACLNARENDPQHAAATAASLLPYFAAFHEPIPTILKRAADEPIIWRDIAYVPPLRRFVFDRVVLLGDAAHATTPNLGQGAAQALEDAVVLAASLRDHADVATALRQYEQARVPRTARVTMMSNRIGNVGQWQRPGLVAVRNWLLRRAPARVAAAQFDYLHGVDLPRLGTAGESTV